MCIIFNPVEFHVRVVNALTALGFLPEKGLVKYYNEQYRGEITPFMKRKLYSPQNEYRIYVRNIKDEPIKFKIGSIKNIAIIARNGRLKRVFSNGLNYILDVP